MDLLNLNIGGTRFVLLNKNVQKYPASFLAHFAKFTHEEKLKNCDGFFEDSHGYYFDRSAHLFESIALLYRIDILKRPGNVCQHVFKKELKFWGINPNLAEKCNCCYQNEARSERKPTVQTIGSVESNKTHESNASLNKSVIPQRSRTNILGGSSDVGDRVQKILSARTAVWKELSKTDDYGLGKCVELISLSFIIITILILFLESFKEVRIYACKNAVIPEIHPEPNFTKTNDTIHEIYYDHVNCQRNKLTQFDIADIVCVVWFTMEFFVYCWASPDRVRFMFTAFGMIDIVSVLPVYAEYGLKFSGYLNGGGLNHIASVFLALRILRALRIVRILKIARYSRGLQVIGEVFKNSFQELSLVFIYTFILTIFFATLIFYAEFGDETTEFDNIPVAAWWAIVTLTTLGYGDIVPVTALGKIIAAVATMSGVVLLAFPISIIVERFTVLYAEASVGPRRKSSIKVRKVGKHIRIQRVRHSKKEKKSDGEDSPLTMCSRDNVNV